MQDWPDASLIKQKRIRLGLTQSELAKRSGVAQAIISRIEAGRILEPSYGVMKTIFTTLHAIESDPERTPIFIPSAGELMNPNVYTVTPEDWVVEAWATMKEHELSQLPVVTSRKHVVGGFVYAPLPESDIDKFIEKKVGDVMSDPFPIVGKKTTLPVLAHFLQAVPAVLVVENEALVGIITSYDLVENAIKRSSYGLPDIEPLRPYGFHKTSVDM